MILSKFFQSDDPRVDLIPIADPFEDTLGVNTPGSGSFDIFSGSGSFADLIHWGSILAFLGVLWSIYTILAYIVALIFLILYVYASVRLSQYLAIQTQQLRDAEKMYDELYRGEAQNNRLKDIFAHTDSENPNDWKLAIIESDIILDNLLKERGYAGNSIGERLKSISSNQLSSLNDAWEAHKVRNRIAHGGADFILTKHIVDETIARYQRVFAEFGVT